MFSLNMGTLMYKMYVEKKIQQTYTLQLKMNLNVFFILHYSFVNRLYAIISFESLKTFREIKKKEKKHYPVEVVVQVGSLDSH